MDLRAVLRPVQRVTLRRRPRRSWAFDGLVAAIVLLWRLPPLLGFPHTPLAVALPVTVVMVSAALVRRLWPVPAFAVAYLALAVVAWSWPQAALDPGMLILLYTVATRCPRSAAVTCAGLLGVAVVVWSVVEYPDDRSRLGAGVMMLAVLVATTLSGLYVATRHALLAQLRQRAEQAEQERDQQGELAATRERARIARELHDIVAHHLTVMVTLADGAAAQVGAAAGRGAGGAAELTRASDAIRTVSDTGRRALTDTRRLLGVLRDASSQVTRAPLPGLAELGELVDAARRTGLPVRLEVDEGLPELDAGTQLAVYRLVQEALTNTLKHADAPAAAVVRLTVRQHELEVGVSDDGRGGAAPPSETGRGLVGMRERVAAVGGEVQSGPIRPHGWLVQARVPLDVRSRVTS